MPSSLTALATTSTEVPEKPACLNDGTECASGTPVAIKVNSDEVYNFYVIDETDNEVTLIMDRNIYAPGSTTDVNVVWHSTSDNSQGPKTAVVVLKERTSSWINIPEREYTYSDDCGENLYSSFSETMRARILTYTEANDIKTANNNTMPSWMRVNLFSAGDNNTFGYWLSSACNGDYDYAHYVFYNGDINYNNVFNPTNYGIRPVITLTK